MNLLCITAGSGSSHGLRGLQHQAVKLAHRRSGFFALDGFTLESVVNRLAKRVPHFLLLLALDRHALRFVLPALLQRLHGVNAQWRLSAQGLCLFNHGLAARQAGLAGARQRCVGRIHGSFPFRLNLFKGLFAQVAGFTPLVYKTVQATDVLLPVGVVVVGLRPRLHFFNEHATLGQGGFGLLFGFFKPRLNHLVGLVAGIVKTLPQRMVRRAALIAGLPLVAHAAQGVLLLAATHGFGHQVFGFLHQLFTDLVGAPTLPAFKFTCRSECGMGGGF